MNSVADILEYSSSTFQDKTALQNLSTYRTFRFSYRKLFNDSNKLANKFMSLGLCKGDSIIICAENCYEWAVTFFACAKAGIILVPLDFNSDTSLVDNIAKDTDAKLLIVSRYSNRAVQFTKRWLIEDTIKLIDDCSSVFMPVTDLDDVLEIVYTSGTTSSPKGVVLTHANVLSNLNALSDLLSFPDNTTLLSLLPLSHMLEQTAGLLFPLYNGFCISYFHSSDRSRIPIFIKEQEITAMVAVPAFLRLLKNRIIDRLGASYSVISVLPVFIRKVIFNLLLKDLRSLQYIIVGGAALDNELERFWYILGKTVLTGYGLTECSPVITCNTMISHKVGTVGKPLPDINIQIAADGEILCKGPNVFSRYYKNDEETANVFCDGWFHTGDIGTLDAESFLTVRGRKKDIILFEDGLNIHPAALEMQINRYACIKDSCVVGFSKAGRTSLVAVISLNAGHTYTHLQSLFRDLKISRIEVWPDNKFPRTPTQKIMRHEVKRILENTVETAPQHKYADPLYTLLADLTDHPVSDDCLLVRDLGIDSLLRVELIGKIASLYGVDIPESVIDPVCTVSKLQTHINQAKSEQTDRYCYYTNFKKFVLIIKSALQRLMSLLLNFFNINVEGIDNITNLTEPCIYILNHESHLDIPVLYKALGVSRSLNVFAAAADDYFYNYTKDLLKVVLFPIIKFTYNLYPFSRRSNIKGSLIRTGRLLDLGFSIVICPQGTRTQQNGGFKYGIGYMAVHTQAPIVPVKIKGTGKVLPKGKLIPCSYPISVIVGKAVYINTDASYIDATNIIERELLNL